MATKGKSDYHYTEEDIAFVRNNIDCMSYVQLAERLSDRVGIKFTKATINALCRRKGIKKTVRMKQHITHRCDGHIYAELEDNWLKENISECSSYKELATMFNATFDVTVSSSSISDRCCKQLHIHRNTNTGVFQKGGIVRSKTYPIGEEKEYNGYIYIKLNNIKSNGKTNYIDFKKNWMPKHRYVYEQYYGIIPKDYIVVFLDNNNRNFDIENLCCISRRVNVIMNSNQWFTDSREHTLTAIKLCQLMLILKEK